MVAPPPGYSVIEIANLIILAKDIVKNTRRACSDHNQFTREVSGLLENLERLKTELSKPESILNRDDIQRGGSLDLTGCEEVLKHVEKVLGRYDRLPERERSFRRAWQMVRFGNGEVRDLEATCARLARWTVSIQQFLNIVCVGSLGRIEQQGKGVQQYMVSNGEELRRLTDSVQRLVTFQRPASRAGSVWTSYADDEVEIWRQLRRDSVAEGISSSVLRRHTPAIRAYIRGLLEERTESERGGDDDQTVSQRTHEWIEHMATVSEESTEPIGAVETATREFKSVSIEEVEDEDFRPGAHPNCERSTGTRNSSQIASSTVPNPSLTTESTARLAPNSLPTTSSSINTPNLSNWRPRNPSATTNNIRRSGANANQSPHTTTPFPPNPFHIARANTHLYPPTPVPPRSLQEVYQIWQEQFPSTAPSNPTSPLPTPRLTTPNHPITIRSSQNPAPNSPTPISYNSTPPPATITPTHIQSQDILSQLFSGTNQSSDPRTERPTRHSTQNVEPRNPTLVIPPTRIDTSNHHPASIKRTGRSRNTRVSTTPISRPHRTYSASSYSSSSDDGHDDDADEDEVEVRPFHWKEKKANGKGILGLFRKKPGRRVEIQVEDSAGEDLDEIVEDVPRVREGRRRRRRKRSHMVREEEVEVEREPVRERERSGWYGGSGCRDSESGSDSSITDLDTNSVRFDVGRSVNRGRYAASEEEVVVRPFPGLLGKVLGGKRSKVTVRRWMED